MCIRDSFTSDKKAPVAKFVKGDEFSLITELQNIDFIKIDVEGSELDAIKGLESTIIEHNPILKIEFSLYALEAAGISPKDIWSYLIMLGYKKYAICSNIDYLENLLTMMQHPPELKGAKDIIFVKGFNNT